ncbi:MAG: bacillithiol biosynthesis cysteine-adding enzyme BshC [Acidobacteriota bacterium]|nr:bacillithiol biosynthesis cysteine-adding enzyme BshC [Acidobacteriota bacterium]
MTASMELQAVPFREIPHTTELFAAFLGDFSRVREFYSHPPDFSGIEAAAREVRLDPEVRRSVAEILRDQNRNFAPGNRLDPATSKNLDRLAAGAVAIVTGQQAGLFSGPAYTFYKALSAARCAEDLTRRGIDAVPVFWIATEDHDLAEVNHSFWNTRHGLARFELPPREEDAGRRVGEVPLGDAVQSLVSDATKTLDGVCADFVSAALRECYEPRETYGSAFGKLMSRLLAGLGVIFLDALDARLHRLAAPLFVRAVAESAGLRDALFARSRDLESAGFHAQVKVTRESTLLFVAVNGRREPVRARNASFFAGDAEYSPSQLASAIEKTPEAFSPNALLRPIVQDSLLPTAASIGGPAEIAYFAQSRVLYDRFLGRMPAIVPRSSFTFVEPPIARFLGMYGLAIQDLFAGLQHVRAEMEKKSLPGGLTARFDDAERALRQLLSQFKSPIEDLDATLGGALQSTQEKMLHQLNQLRGKVGRAENFRTGVLDRHRQILFDALYPAGSLQERSLSFLPLLAAYGHELIDRIMRLGVASESGAERLTAREHRIVFL